MISFQKCPLQSLVIPSRIRQSASRLDTLCFMLTCIIRALDSMSICASRTSTRCRCWTTTVRAWRTPASWTTTRSWWRSARGTAPGRRRSPPSQPPQTTVTIVVVGCVNRPLTRGSKNAKYMRDVVYGCQLVICHG